MRVGVVVNPVAGGGRTRKAWPAARDALKIAFSDLSIEQTQAPGDGGRLARRLAAQGAQLIIAAGGDGTVSEVCDGLVQARADGRGGVDLAILPLGTGADLARSLGVSGDVDALIERIKAGRKRTIDAGRVRFRDEAGRDASRVFVNVASLGVSGPTVRAVNAVKHRGRASGKTVFLWHTVRELVRYRFDRVRITVDNQPPIEERIALVAIANGRYLGGGMMIAPDASLDDALLDVVIVKAGGKLRLVADLRQLYSGAHRDNPLCRFMRGRRVTVEPIGEPALIDVDGEAPGRIPATFEVLPGALTLRG